jgi:large subunit ribosomal protein L7/L12
MATVSPEDILETIENMTLLQVADLVKKFEEKFGVSAAAVAVAVAAGGSAAAQWEQTEFTVVLIAAGDNKSTSSKSAPSPGSA